MDPNNNKNKDFSEPPYKRRRTTPPSSSSPKMSSDNLSTTASTSKKRPSGAESPKTPENTPDSSLAKTSREYFASALAAMFPPKSTPPSSSSPKISSENLSTEASTSKKGPSGATTPETTSNASTSNSVKYFAEAIAALCNKEEESSGFGSRNTNQGWDCRPQPITDQSSPRPGQVVQEENIVHSSNPEEKKEDSPRPYTRPGTPRVPRSYVRGQRYPLRPFTPEARVLKTRRPITNKSKENAEPDELSLLVTISLSPKAAPRSRVPPTTRIRKDAPRSGVPATNSIQNAASSAGPPPARHYESPDYTSDIVMEQRHTGILADALNYIAKSPFPDSADLNKYELISKVGEGAYGTVFKACIKEEPTKLVALKSIDIFDGCTEFPTTAIREVRILKMLKHPNIVNFHEVCHTELSATNNYCVEFYLVFEFCDFDLADILDCKTLVFSLGHIKNILKQMLNGIEYMHGKQILHRDLKPDNILVTATGVVKIADFGLSRVCSEPSRGMVNSYSGTVVTLPYRAPEIIMGDENYGKAIDMWSYGCVMGELFKRSRLFTGTNDLEQLLQIRDLCGSLNVWTWPGVRYLRHFNHSLLNHNCQRGVNLELGRFVRNSAAMDMLNKLLKWSPSERLTAAEAVQHQFFYNHPTPENLGPLIARNMFL